MQAIISKRNFFITDKLLFLHVFTFNAGKYFVYSQLPAKFNY